MELKARGVSIKMSFRLCIVLVIAVQVVIAQPTDSNKSHFIETHRADADLAAAFRGGSSTFSDGAQQAIVQEYLGVEYDLKGSSKLSQQELRRTGLEALHVYLGNIAAVDQTEIRSLRSTFLDKLGKGALVFPEQKRYGIIVVDSAPQAEEVIVNSTHFAGTVGRLCVLPGSYTVMVKRPKLASCTIHVQLASADVKTATCK